MARPFENSCARSFWFVWSVCWRGIYGATHCKGESCIRSLIVVASCFLDTFFGHVTSGIWLVWDAYPNICLMYLRYTVLYEYGICICIYIYISTPGRVCSWCAAGFPIWNKYKVRIQEEFDEVNLFLDVDVASVRGIAGSNVRTAQLLDIKRDIYVYHVAYGCVSAQKHGSYTWKASCIVTRSFLLETSRLKFNMRVPRRA